MLFASLILDAIESDSEPCKDAVLDTTKESDSDNSSLTSADTDADSNSSKSLYSIFSNSCSMAYTSSPWAKVAPPPSTIPIPATPFNISFTFFLFIDTYPSNLQNQKHKLS